MQPRTAGRDGSPSRPRVAEVLLAVFAILASVPLHAAQPPGLWNQKASDAAALDAAWKTQPPALRPAIDFEILLIRIRAGAPVPEWRDDMLKVAQAPAADGPATAVRELARAWQARLAVEEIERVALRRHYANTVRFPEKLDEVRAQIPEPLRLDPWGEPWVYALHAPQGFGKLTKQRYQLGPARFPNLTPIDRAAKWAASPSGLKLAARDGGKALEIRLPDGRSGVVQPGARVGEVLLVFVGEGWALLADTERLFTVVF